MSLNELVRSRRCSDTLLRDGRLLDGRRWAGQRDRVSGATRSKSNEKTVSSDSSCVPLVRVANRRSANRRQIGAPEFVAETQWPRLALYGKRPRRPPAGPPLAGFFAGIAG